MNLFQHAHTVLRDFRSQVGRESNLEPGEVLSFTTSMTIQPSVGIEQHAGSVDVLAKKTNGGTAPDWNMVSESCADFCGSVLNYTFNPLIKGKPRYKDDEMPVIFESVEGDPNKIGVVITSDKKLNHMFEEAAQEIVNTEKQVFHGWNGKPTSAIVKKTFVSSEERERIEHLLFCMSGAFGMDDEATAKKFHPAGDDKTLHIDRNFLKMLIDREGTMEAGIRENRI